MTASIRDLLETCPVDALVTNAHVDEFVAWFEEQGYDLVRRESKSVEAAVALVAEIIGHYSCDDCWYSCPKSAEGSCNENYGDECTCQRDIKAEAIVGALQRAGWG